MIREDCDKHGLLLIRTPLQAWIVKKVISAEDLDSYDLLYFTQNNSEEDRHYYGELAPVALNARFCWAPERRFDVLSHLDFYRQTLPWKHPSEYSKVILASINSPIMSAIVAHHKRSELITFDDGLANIVPNGMYQNKIICWRAEFYRRMLGGTSLGTLKQRICHHYSIYEGFENIIEKDRVRLVEGWKPRVTGVRTGAPAVTYFVGQPFQEVMNQSQIDNMQARLKEMKVDYYVRHPRERDMLSIGATPIEKHGRIAEDAILHHAEDRPVHLIGWFSSALFNLANIVERCTVLLIKESPETPEKRSLALKAGCQVEFI